jgi:hypothetical protein
MDGCARQDVLDNPLGPKSGWLMFFFYDDNGESWINMFADGAKADDYVTVTQLGGDGVADPVIGFINAYFR